MCVCGLTGLHWSSLNVVENVTDNTMCVFKSLQLVHVEQCVTANVKGVFLFSSCFCYQMQENGGRQNRKRQGSAHVLA